MPPTDFDIWTRIAIPLLTFALGIVATFAMQRVWRKRTLVAQSAKALAELTADWYNQLDTLEKEVRNAKGGDAPVLVDAYLRNRLILPKILYHLSILRERNICPELVSDVERFLSQVTSYGDLANVGSWRCQDVLSGAAEKGNFRSTLQQLDDCQQAVARQAARVAD